MKHFASASFWDNYEKLPRSIQELANRNFDILKRNPRHPSLHVKKVGRYWSARVGQRHRALAVEIEEVSSGSGLALTQTTTSLCSSQANRAFRRVLP
jgi:hypothetical protein